MGLLIGLMCGIYRGDFLVTYCSNIMEVFKRGASETLHIAANSCYSPLFTPYFRRVGYARVNRNDSWWPLSHAPVRMYARPSAVTIACLGAWWPTISHIGPELLTHFSTSNSYSGDDMFFWLVIFHVPKGFFTHGFAWLQVCGSRHTSSWLCWTYAVASSCPVSLLCYAKKLYCDGGGVSDISIEGGTFRGNSAEEHGGAITIWGDDTLLTITGGTFESNTARWACRWITRAPNECQQGLRMGAPDRKIYLSINSYLKYIYCATCAVSHTGPSQYQVLKAMSSTQNVQTRGSTCFLRHDWSKCQLSHDIYRPQRLPSLTFICCTRLSSLVVKVTVSVLRIYLSVYR